MFNKDLYPTPENVILQMIQDIDFVNKHVLEPSAGTGNITNLLEKMGANVSFCEIEEKLISMNAGEFLCNDFLQLTSQQASHFDYIVMNPPFSADEKHILHAYEIAPSGCTVIALCNWETISNDYGRHRQQLTSLIDNFGTSENIGNCFADSERKTNVEIGLIKLYKPNVGETEFDGYFDAYEEEQGQESGLIKHNEIRELVGRYIQAVQMFEEVEEVSNRINEIVKPFAYFDIKFGATSRKHHNITRAIFKKQLQKDAWNNVLYKMNMEKYVTNSVMEKLNKFVEKNHNIPFTVKNIFKMVSIIHGTHENTMKETLAGVFDRITERYHGNRENVEGWKTNNQYFVGKKFILDSSGINMSYGGYPEMNYYFYNKHILDDFIKSICFLTGANYDNMLTFKETFEGPRKEYTKTLNLPKKQEWGKWFDFNMFDVKIYKKGTMHVKFKDEKTREMFNIAVAKIKGWRLPERTGSDFRRKTTDLEIF